MHAGARAAEGADGFRIVPFSPGAAASLLSSGGCNWMARYVAFVIKMAK